jgi:hypothetical protein
VWSRYFINIRKTLFAGKSLMADSLLNSSITAVRTKIINDIASASVKDLVSLARAAKSLGLGDDSDIENAINTRVNSFAASATVAEIKDLSQAIKQVKNEYAATINNADDISDGANNKFLSTANLNTELGSLSTNIIPDTDVSRNLGSAGNKFNTIYGAKVTGLLSPIDAGDAATKAYVDTNSGANITQVVALTHTGELSAYTGVKRWYAPKNITISKIKARVDTAPTGAGVVVQINKTSLGVTTNQQLTIADGTTLISDTSPTISSMLEDDYLTVDIVSVGTTTAGENLTVEITYK